jgi:hypothetical protein
VTGKVAPDIVKPVPFNVAELMVTGDVPVEVNVRGSVDAVFNGTLPKAKLVWLMANVGTLDPTTFSCKAKALEMPPALAVKVTDCAVDTDDTIVVNPALVALGGIVTVTGTVTAAALLVRPTLKPPLPAAAFSVTVQVSLPDPITDPLVQESALNVADAPVPVPAVPAFVVAAVVLPGLLPQPDTAMTMKQHANIVRNFAHEPSCLRIGSRLPEQHGQ